jgi:hypothetical protein
MAFELKSIAKESVPRALEKAERYRLLNEPFLAESICLDVLAVDPGNAEVLVVYILALTDQFQTGGHANAARAKEAIAKLPNEYDRLYYAGLVCERRGHAYATSTSFGSNEAAWEFLVEAIELYDKAHEVQHAASNDDTTLRRNTCVRLIESHRLTEPSRERPTYSSE